MRRSPALIVLGLIALWLIAAGCGGHDHTTSRAKPDAIAAKITPLPAGPAIGADDDSSEADDGSFETVLAPLHDVEVLARVDGEVMSILAEEGQRVSVGKPLARMDDRELRALLEEREAEVARTESAWARAQRLQADKVISEEQFIASRAEWQIAKARRDQVAIQHDHCTVRAPFGGIVAVRRAQVGQMVKAGTLLFRISDPDRLRAELLLPEAYFGAVRAGQMVTLVPVAGGKGAVAKVTRVNPLVDPASGTFRVVIDLDNRRARLPAGMSVHVAFDPPLSRR